MRTRLLIAAAGLAAVAWAEHRRRLVRNVPAELRRPLLAVSLGLPHPALARLGRRLLDADSTVVPGVRLSRLVARGGPGQHDVPLVRYEPADRRTPGGVLLWIHGGGLVLGTPGNGHERCSHLARELGVLVLSVDYRLAPEHPYPAAIDDATTALRWLHAHAAELGVDPARVAVGGDSAGGGLAAALAQRAQDDDLPVVFQLLVYPMLDDRTVLRGRPGIAGPLTWTPMSNRSGWSGYLGRPPRWEDARPYAAAARREDLTGLPPAWIGVGDLDLFHDEGVEYARRLGRAGVPCELLVVPGMYHAADVMVDPRPASMQAFWQSSVDALAAALRARRPARG